MGFFKSKSFKTPIIAVGNLSVGGTGKTPQIEYLIRLLKDEFKVAVLSRGYKRKTEGYLLLNDTHSVLDVGDEPLQFYKKFENINVAVDANRVEGVANLIKQKNPEIILLDDAFQHRKIKASFYILLTKYDDLFVDDFLLPTGNLRESSRGTQRTNLIIVTKCPSDLSIIHQQKIKSRLEKFNKEVFFSTISYGKIKSNFNSFTINELKEYQIVLITGIANPSPLLSFLINNSINFKHLKYKDHHNFSTKELKEIESEFNAITSDKKVLLTTEKDYTRLQDFFNHIYYIEIEILFLQNQNKEFNKKILNHIQQNRC
jgi:tetraacyldisaccharide 4'-kinase